MTDDGAPEGGTLVRQGHASPTTPPDRNLIERFVNLSATLTPSSSATDAAEAIGVAALALTGGQRGAVYVQGADGQATRLWASDGGFLDHGGLSGPGPLIFPDVKDLPPGHDVRQTAERGGYRALASWPLNHAGKAVGSVVCCFDAPRAWSAAEIDVMSALAMQAAAALECALHPGRDGGQWGGGPDDARVAEALRILLAESTSLFEAHRELEAQHARLVQARQELGALKFWLLALYSELRHERSRLTVEQSQLTKARDELASEDARITAARYALETQIAAARNELEKESARLMAEMRQELSQGRTRPAPTLESPADPPLAARTAPADPARISDAKRVLEQESARLVEALETGRAPAAEALTAPSSAVEAASADGRPETPRAVQAVELGGPLTAPRGLEDLFPLLVERAAKLLNTDRGPLAADDQVKILGRALDDRDGHRAGYSERLEAWAEATAGMLGCDRATITDIRRAALLHDLGKIGVPEAILRATARLTDQERQLVRSVPALAEQILRPVKGMEGVAAILGHRYEQWDGKGYPDALRGDRIPLGARILAVVDAYGVMTTVRPYRAMVYSLDAVAELRRCAGAQFDPRVVEAFCSVLKREG
ncbi:MAG TPA: HD domain-containing phosphohydrolase [bacterium]|nr:HD domain-containing phosphohydrolase [bacterium]